MPRTDAELVINGKWQLRKTFRVVAPVNSSEAFACVRVMVSIPMTQLSKTFSPDRLSQS